MLENSLFLHAQTSCCGEILNSNCKHVNNFFFKVSSQMDSSCFREKLFNVGYVKTFYLCFFIFILNNKQSTFNDRSV